MPVGHSRRDIAFRCEAEPGGPGVRCPLPADYVILYRDGRRKYFCHGDELIENAAHAGDGTIVTTCRLREEGVGP